jgi:cell wall-associated NlpC family hydrolase
VLAAINKVETNYGRNLGVSSKGAVGWMQFLPSTWLRWGVDGDGDGLADPWNPRDAVYAAARYLAASGGKQNIRRAVFAYNHADWYVDSVLEIARVFDPRGLPDGSVLRSAQRTFDIDPLGVELEVGQGKIARAARRVERAEKRLDELEWVRLDVERRAGDPDLSEHEFRQVESLSRKLAGAAEDAEAAVAKAQAELDAAEERVETLQAEAALISSDQAAAEVGLAGRLAEPPTAAARGVIDYAIRQLGVPYTWGGNHGASLEQMITGEPSIWEGGFDCSSLVAWAFAKGAGLYVGDVTGIQWAYGASAAGAIRGKGPGRGGEEPPGGFRPGDLIFFNATDHVGIYVGNDLFVHAPHTGDVVRVTKLSGYSPVWGWVRWTQVSGQPGDADPGIGAPRVEVFSTDGSDDGRVFAVVS